ncbi:hypothetical protein TNIN_387831 [Trichonephila inaurata madagascariensis]|uniref:Uncharacterized protein n=1 Tax=Trichonephila inaurata madagascariensis TaxID=2747483 RepID=A0A8X6XLG9_9ARAC|nr:hypothetical protein TNIN_387831 [Trichonephila inaurata madagascariensis]
MPVFPASNNISLASNANKHNIADRKTQHNLTCPAPSIFPFPKKITDMRGKGKNLKKSETKNPVKAYVSLKKIEALLSTQEGKVPVTPVNEPPLATEPLVTFD